MNDDLSGFYTQTTSITPQSTSVDYYDRFDTSSDIQFECVDRYSNEPPVPTFQDDVSSVYVNELTATFEKM